jgi:hypothetical protein
MEVPADPFAISEHVQQLLGSLRPSCFQGQCRLIGE